VDLKAAAGATLCATACFVLAARQVSAESHHPNLSAQTGLPSASAVSTAIVTAGKTDTSVNVCAHMYKTACFIDPQEHVKVAAGYRTCAKSSVSSGCVCRRS